MSKAPRVENWKLALILWDGKGGLRITRMEWYEKSGRSTAHEEREFTLDEVIAALWESKTGCCDD